MAGISRFEKRSASPHRRFRAVHRRLVPGRAEYLRALHRHGIRPQEPSAPDPASEEAPAEGERPDSLLPGEVIDLNAADAYDLDRLPGIGPAKAEAILAYREEYGPFQSVDDLLAVSGIGEVTLENLRPYVTAGGAAETAEATGG